MPLLPGAGVLFKESRVHFVGTYFGILQIMLAVLLLVTCIAMWMRLPITRKSNTTSASKSGTDVKQLRLFAYR